MFCFAKHLFSQNKRSLFAKSKTAIAYFVVKQMLSL